MPKWERTEKIRRDFVANVSHELRTPITIIRGYNEAICDGMVTDTDLIQRYRGLINEETVRLERMVRELHGNQQAGVQQSADCEQYG